MAKAKKTIAQIQRLVASKKGKIYREKTGDSHEYYNIVDVLPNEEGCIIFVANYMVNEDTRIVNEYYTTINPTTYYLFFDDLKPVKRASFLKLKRMALTNLGSCKGIITSYKKTYKK